MKFSREIQLSFMSLFTILTFRKFYICENCNKIHKFTGNEFEICVGWYKPYIYVNNECAYKTIERARKLLMKRVMERNNNEK